MNRFFEVGAKYAKTLPDGTRRKVSKTVLIEAETFTEAERRFTEQVPPYIEDLHVVSEKIVNYEEVVTTTDDQADTYYKVKHNLITMDERTMQEKRQPQYIIIQAASVDDARERYKQHVKGWACDVVLEAISETKYMDFLPY